MYLLLLIKLWYLIEFGGHMLVYNSSESWFYCLINLINRVNYVTLFFPKCQLLLVSRL